MFCFGKQSSNIYQESAINVYTIQYMLHIVCSRALMSCSKPQTRHSSNMDQLQNEKTEVSHQLQVMTDTEANINVTLSATNDKLEKTMKSYKDKVLSEHLDTHFQNMKAEVLLQAHHQIVMPCLQTLKTMQLKQLILKLITIR